VGGPSGTNAPGAPFGGGAGGIFSGTGRGSIPPQNVAEVSTNWPAGNVEVRLANFLDQAQQKWTLTAVTNAGGYPGSPYFKITISGTERALAATDDRELVTRPAFTGAPEQLWRFDQLADGTWRIMPKSVPNFKGSLALSAIGSSSATLSKFDPASDKQRWVLKAQ
jgi:arabinan endo-1,5-alpha-L-arabinosidase